MRRAKSAQKASTAGAAPVASDAVQAWPLATRPGLLIRRLHQFHVALFAEGAAHLAITPVQFSLLSAIAARGLADQTTLAADVALDRSTCTSTLARLEKRGWVHRRRDEADGRARLCSLTGTGARILAEATPAAREAHRRTLALLSEDEAAAFLRLAGKALSCAANGGGV